MFPLKDLARKGLMSNLMEKYKNGDLVTPSQISIRSSITVVNSLAPERSYSNFNPLRATFSERT